ncbi:N-acetylmuramoyl-L-alanine amidase [Pontibacter aydingkolensis]|uniref:N-acetylmuramoyl-L-alanine amidase n=1 Tax=Pontibacter aydingkolensis TaxID=1911536 RepID=A0ABS7CT68_9BACT|nr:N-acetylmuramoyl-L-alanine amidase [Pontibacter aydingkolensis]MBW7466891.1 N-acetylmuramoyl-L-alanine amidase [Pontibacter aydingkolensis]
MKHTALRISMALLAGIFVASCTPNPYAATNKVYKKQAKAYGKTLWAEPKPDPEITYPQGDYWVGATNFNMRKPNYVIIHHTAQNSTAQTLKTFTTPATQVSAHYVIGRDGKVYQMLNDYLRAWHGGASRWGNNTDINSSSIGIELDNNGAEPFAEPQINSLIGVLEMLKKKHAIPAANFIGHSDIAPTRKVDPNPTFPWKQLATSGFGLWYDENALDSVVVAKTVIDSVAIADSTLLQPEVLVFEQEPVHKVPDTFNPVDALRIIGYDVRNPEAAIKAFKLHFIQTEINAVLTEKDKLILYNLYKKYL